MKILENFKKFSFFLKRLKRTVFESPKSIFHVLKSHFRDFAFFEIRDFRRPICSCSLRFPREAALDLLGPPEAVRPNWASYRYSGTLPQA